MKGARLEDDPLAGLAMALFGREWRTGLICMLQVFFDESESQAPNDVFTLVGCVSTCEKWIRFKDAWRERLGRHDIEYWHTTDWVRREPPYDSLADAEYAALPLDLRGFIEGEDVLLCVMQVVPLEFYRQEFSQTLHREAMRAYSMDPYFFCFLTCMKMLSDAQKDGRLPEGRIHTFFERRDKGHDRNLVRQQDRVRQLKEFAPGQFGPALGGTKRDPEWTPCQAADLVAHGVMSSVRQGLFGSKEPVSVDFRAMNESRKLIGGQFVDRDIFHRFIVGTRTLQAQLDAIDAWARENADD